MCCNELLVCKLYILRLCSCSTSCLHSQVPLDGLREKIIPVTSVSFIGEVKIRSRPIQWTTRKREYRRVAESFRYIEDPL